MVKFIGPYFSRPILNEEVTPDFSMYAELQNLFSRIPDDATIRAAIYMWNDATGIPKKGYRDKWKDEPGNPNQLTQTFLERARNGDVKVIFDSYNEQNHPHLIKRLSVSLGPKNVIVDPRTNKMNDPEVRREMAKADILAKSGYMHDKFILINELEGIGKYVVIQMTANINVTQAHQFNNMIVVYDDKELYSKYMRHWSDLNENIKVRNEGRKIPSPNVFRNDDVHVEPDTPVAVWFMPRDKCPVEAEINSILKDAGERTRIDIAMAYLTRPRIRKLILKLKEKRCRVRVLLSDEFQNRKTTVPMLTGASVPLKVIYNEHFNKEVYWLGDEKQCRDNWRGRMHHKFVLIEHDQNQIVWTGSYNLTHPGLRYNDETVLRINDSGTYRRYKHHFEVLFKNDKALRKRITL